LIYLQVAKTKKMKMNAYSDSVLELSILIEFGIDLFLTHIHICLLEMKSDKTKKKRAAG